MSADAIESKFWRNNFDKTDLNYYILNKYTDIFQFNKTNWLYNAGKVFSIKTKYLRILYDNFKSIYNKLTDINTHDNYWKKNMMDLNIFDSYYNKYKSCQFNNPIDKDAFKMLIKTNSKNYYELFSHGYRGIPDLQIEHAIERYIGYLYNDANIMCV